MMVAVLVSLAIIAVMAFSIPVMDYLYTVAARREPIPKALARAIISPYLIWRRWAEYWISKINEVKYQD